MSNTFTFLQSIGFVVSLVVFILLTVLTLYVSYVLTLGLALSLAVFVTYKVLKAAKNLEKPTS